MIDSAALRARLAGVREQIARAADRAGRDPSSIRLIAVSKTFSVDHVRVLIDAGQRDFGENKIQEALPKIEATAGVPALRWHLVGHLQSNKARKAAAHFHVVHSVDTPDLMRRIDQAAAESGRSLNVLLQVDLAREPTKHGAVPEDLPAILQAASEAHRARTVGLMVLPPAGSAEAARAYFKRLRELRDEIAISPPGPDFSELSMGMSHDFDVAIEEGATMVRVGTAIFGTRAT